MTDTEYMKEALKEAKKSLEYDEVPVGAIVVYNNKIIARSHNERESKTNPLGHAEVCALKRASEVLGSWNLSECTLYVTLEPCVMCAGACIQSRVGRVVFAADGLKTGCFGSVIDLNAIPEFTHKIKIDKGLMKEDSETMMKTYFQEKRKQAIKVRKIDANEWDTYRAIRNDVFIEEQQVDPDIEFDAYDVERPDVIHVGAFKDGVMHAVCRLIKTDDVMKIGRVATLKSSRGQGFAGAMMKYAIKQAQNNGTREIHLGAQLQALSFYEQFGFEAYGDVYLDANIEHRNMMLVIKQDV